jgi:hypothetical protein
MDFLCINIDVLLLYGVAMHGLFAVALGLGEANPARGKSSQGQRHRMRRPGEERKVNAS